MTDKASVFARVRGMIEAEGLRIASMDDGQIVEVHDIDETHPLPEQLRHGFHA